MTAPSGNVVLVVGLGSIGRRHARIAREMLPRATIVALRRQPCDAGSAGVDRIVTSIDEAVCLKPRVAAVANPAPFHLDAAIPLARAGVHVLVEKPISATSAGVDELIAAAAGNRTVLMTGYNLRFLRSLRELRELVRGGRIGRVRSVRAEAGQALESWRPDADYRQTVSARAELGGGVLLELSHEIDYLRWILGEVEWVSAVATRQSSLDIDVEDTAHMVLGFAPAGAGAPVVGSLAIDFIRHDAGRACTVIGETGSLRWNAAAGSVEVFTAQDPCWRTIFEAREDRDASYRSEWRHFLACVEGREQPLVTGADGLAAVRIVEAARRSSDTRAVATVR